MVNLRSSCPWLVRAGLAVVAALLALPTAGAGTAVGQTATERTDAAIRRHLARRADIGAARVRDRAAVVPPPAAGLVPLAPVPLARRPLSRLDPGDLLTSAGVDSNALRVTLRPKGARIRRESLTEAFVSRGIDHDAASGRIAIAAVSRVLIYDTETTELVVLTSDGDGDPFGFVNDVFFDEDGQLLIADQGAEPNARLPRDGRLWQYDPLTGQMQRIAGRKALSNPAFIAADSRGRIFVVDLEAGRLVTPLLEARWDRVLLLRGARRKGGRFVYRGEGIQATAFDVGPDDRMWFGSFSEIVLLDGKQIELPCPILELPFDFVTGLVVTDASTALVSDGASTVTARRSIHEVDDSCDARVRAMGKRLGGSRGLARVAEAETESPG